MASVAVVQPYIPEYRIPFFKAVEERLRNQGHTLVVLAGTADADQAVRGDTARLPEIEVSLRTRRHALGPLRWRSTGALEHLRQMDVCVVELAAGSIDTFNALTRAHIPVGVWGHVDDYVSKGSIAGRAIKRWQVRRAHAVLAYTATGAARARRWGARADKVFTLNNTVDLSSLQRAIDQREALPTVDEDDRARTFSYIGGLDASKRIDLVAEALKVLWESGSSVRLLVAGGGTQRHLLRPAEERGQVVLLGRADDAIKADMAARSVALLNPGRVGLLAVESPVLGLPIITTNGARHAPEFEYLTPGANTVLTQANGQALADALARIATDRTYLFGLQQSLREIAGQPTLTGMVSSFVSGIEHLLRSSARKDD